LRRRQNITVKNWEEKTMTLSRTLILGAALAISTATVATAQNLRGAGGASPNHPSTYMYERFASYLEEESGGSMSLTLVGSEVVSLLQVPDALQSELISVGNVLPLFFAADFQRTNVAGDMALMGRDSHAMALAMTEFVVNCEPCQQEFSNKGMVFLGAGASDVYVLITTSPVRTAADLQGLRLRSGGAPFARWAENFGATPVSIAVGEQFEGMNQGTIDGSMASIVDMLSFRLVDVAKYVTEVPLGTYHVTSNFSFGKPAWASLSEEQRATVVRAANRANPTLTDRWGFQLPEAARNAVGGSSIEVITPDADLLEASSSFAMEDAAARIAADPLAADFAALVEKWSGIVAELGNDPDVLSARAFEEIWANVDLSTYGL
jgi:TRAP-type transport system periplasmic protein